VGLPENIKRLRKQKKWSQTVLADKVGSHLSHINRIETGKYKPSLDVLKKLAEVLEVSLDYLTSETDEDFEEVKIEDTSLAQRIKLIDSLDEEDRQALIRVIDSMLTKKKILNLVTNQDMLETNLTQK
jgi:transcriptional regulator with XRE-family HTH domain